MVIGLVGWQCNNIIAQIISRIVNNNILYRKYVDEIPTIDRKNCNGVDSSLSLCFGARIILRFGCFGFMNLPPRYLYYIS
jgi:hypothetical protein